MGMPNQVNQQQKEMTSQFKGVSWYKRSRKWYAQLSFKGQKKYGGHFNDELDAGKRVNQLCEEMGIPPQNPEISAIPNQQYSAKEKTSQYKGVTWHKQRKVWYVRVVLKGQTHYGGLFNNELEAGKRANQLCEELGIPSKNPEISATKNPQHQHEDCQIITNPVISSEILETHNDDANQTKRNQDKLPVQTHYFYKHMLK